MIFSVSCLFSVSDSVNWFFLVYDSFDVTSKSLIESVVISNSSKFSTFSAPSQSLLVEGAFFFLKNTLFQVFCKPTICSKNSRTICIYATL